MVVLTNKILFLILLNFILQNKVLNQSLTVDTPRPNNDEYSVQSELTRNLKKRLNDFGSLKPQVPKEEPTPVPKSEDSYLEKSRRPTLAETINRDTSSDRKTYPGAYQPRPKQDFLTANFEDFLSKQNKELLERYVKAPHDFVLVVDESGSISSYNWGAAVKDFVNLVTTALSQLNGDINLSIVQYSHTPKMIMEPRKLNKITLPSVLKVIKHMFDAKRTHGTTYTGKALEFVRDQVLDPRGQFVLELSESSTPLNKKNMVVILMTDGGSKDYEKALEESLIQRFNGVDFYVFGIGNVNEPECRKLVGCSMTGECNNFIHAQWNTVLEYLYNLLSSICRDAGKNATCLETWSDFGECSAPCGGGVRKAKLLKVTTVAEATTGLEGIKGMTCEEQYKNVTEKSEPCNEFPCEENLVTINEHTPEEDMVVPSHLLTMIYGNPRNGRTRSVEEPDTKKEDEENDEEKVDLENDTDTKEDTPEPVPEPMQQQQTHTVLESTREPPRTEKLSEPEPEKQVEQPVVTQPAASRVVSAPRPTESDPDMDTSHLSHALKDLTNRGRRTRDTKRPTVNTEPEKPVEQPLVSQESVSRVASARESEDSDPDMDTSHLSHALKDLTNRGRRTRDTKRPTVNTEPEKPVEQPLVSQVVSSRVASTKQPEEPEPNMDTSHLSHVLRDLTKPTVTTEPEPLQRVLTRVEPTNSEEMPVESSENSTSKSYFGDALRPLVDQGPELEKVPFQLVGTSEHQNLHVDHVLNDREVEALEKRNKPSTERLPLPHPTRREEDHEMRQVEEPVVEQTRLTEPSSESPLESTGLNESRSEPLLEPRETHEPTYETRETQTPRVLDRDTQTRSVSDRETQTISVSDRDTQTRSVSDRGSQTSKELEPVSETRDVKTPEPESRVVETTEHTPQMKQHETAQRHTPTANMEHNTRHAPAHDQRRNTRHAPEEHSTTNLPNVGSFAKNFKQKFRNFFHNEKVKKLSAVTIVIFLTAISISVFSYTFLRDKEPTPHLFDPSDQEFMNAGDGDDVEPSENYQVSNMEDGIWA